MDALTLHFSVDDLQTLTFRLDIDWSEIGGELKDQRARELIEYCERRNMTDRLIANVETMRPLVVFSWKNE